MKRIISFFLFLLFIIPPFVGCSNEPVEFSDKLPNNRACYIEVTGIKAKEAYYETMYVENYGSIISHYFVCECDTQSGNFIYMAISAYDYKENFDSSADTGSGYAIVVPEKIEFPEAVKLLGYATAPEKIVGISSTYKSLKKVFYFESVDTEEASK